MRFTQALAVTTFFGLMTSVASAQGAGSFGDNFQPPSAQPQYNQPYYAPRSRWGQAQPQYQQQPQYYQQQPQYYPQPRARPAPQYYGGGYYQQPQPQYDPRFARKQAEFEAKRNRKAQEKGFVYNPYTGGYSNPDQPQYRSRQPQYYYED